MSIAASGDGSDARTTGAWPPTIAGASRATRPSSAGSGGATIPTTPVGSGIVKLKYGAATGFEVPRTCAYLSAQPAYQTQRSIADSLSPPNGELGSKRLYVFAQIPPASRRCAIERIRDPFSVHTPADRPYGVLFAFSTASSGVLNVSTESTGPKISSCAIR